MSSTLKLKDQYNRQGYFKIENFFKEDFIKYIKKEIGFLKLKKSRKIRIYTDKQSRVHRIERFYQISEKIKSLNKIILKELQNIFNEEFVIFKDKCNFKAPGDEGFFAHYDGIFKWKDSNSKIRKGWEEYSAEFITVLVTLDDFTLENGTLEISQRHNGSFEKLFERIAKHITPYKNPFAAGEQVYQEAMLAKEQILKCEFEPLIVKAGSLIFFSSRCPHRSAKNKSNKNRDSLYLTYNPARFGDHYEGYFNDKKKSKNLVN